MNQNTLNTQHLNINNLIDYINECYDGNVLYLISQLDHSIYLMHYLQDESFNPRELHNAISAIKGLRECLMQAHLEQKEWKYQPLH